MRSIYAKPRFFIAIGVIVITFVLIFVFKWPMWIGHVFVGALILLSIIDFWILHQAAKGVTATRKVSDQLSLSDLQSIVYEISNNSSINLTTTIIDELPLQLQHRDFLYNTTIVKNCNYKKSHKIRPVMRGLYEFGKLHLYLNTTIIQLIDKRITFDLDKSVEVHPSFIQMQEYELQIFNKVATMHGIKRVRRLGQTDEFEHIKNYTQGDNIKSINWKATSRRGELMINQYQDTRSQSVYCIIDKGRSMKMPFENLALLDYAINSALVLSNIVLKKYDRAGLVTFNETLSTMLKADNRQGQLSLISESLYNESTGYKESNFQALYYHLRKNIARRSVLILFSNFEHTYDMRRALPYLRQLNKLHLLVVIFFTNTELLSESDKTVETLSDIYSTTFAKKALIEKDLIAEELSIHGIQVILSTPEELSINVINKYLEIKAKRMV